MSMSTNLNQIINVYKDSFRLNLYTVDHFRMIGIIDVDFLFQGDIERVTLAFYSSSGVNSGKIKGLWYPIVGIKIYTGAFVEFPPLINSILTQTTYHGSAQKGWLAKSPFFYGKLTDSSQIVGFSNSSYYHALLEIGKLLRAQYETGDFQNLKTLSPTLLNQLLFSQEIYSGNQYAQQENFQRFISDIFYHTFKAP